MLSTSYKEISAQSQLVATIRTVVLIGTNINTLVRQMQVFFTTFFKKFLAIKKSHPIGWLNAKKNKSKGAGLLLFVFFCCGLFIC